jgi:hypothetical protein
MPWTVTSTTINFVSIHNFFITFWTCNIGECFVANIITVFIHCMKIAIRAMFASTVFLQPTGGRFTLSLAWVIRNTCSLIGIRISILWASAAHTALVHDVSWIDANLSINTLSLICETWNHICVTFFAFIFGYEEVITGTSNLQGSALSSAAHVLVVWTLLKFSWTVFTDWACIPLVPFRCHIGATRPDYTFCIICIRNHVIIALNTVPSIIWVPNMICWHRITFSNTSRAIIVNISVCRAVYN